MHRDLVAGDRVGTRDLNSSSAPASLGTIAARRAMRSRSTPIAANALRRNSLRVEALAARAEVVPAMEHEIDELLDLAAAAMLARDRQQHQLRGAERDLRLLRVASPRMLVEEAAQRADRVRDRRGSRRPASCASRDRARQEAAARGLRRSGSRPGPPPRRHGAGCLRRPRLLRRAAFVLRRGFFLRRRLRLGCLLLRRGLASSRPPSPSASPSAFPAWPSASL